MNFRKAIASVGLSISIYCLLAWFYEILMLNIWCPQCASVGVAHLPPLLWIRNDTFALLSFAMSFVGFVVWQLAKENNQ